MPFVPSARDFTIHQYTSKLIAIEHRHVYTGFLDQPPENLILWIHGLGDGLLTVPYPARLAGVLPQAWSIVEILLSSSYGAWGTSSLKTDVDNLAQAVRYFRGIRNGKIVFMGHSTGCQDVMEYLVGAGQESRPTVDGAILQAPVSDREGIQMQLSNEDYADSAAVAQTMIDEGKAEEIVPTSVTRGIFGGPVTARRWISLLSPNHDGEDDYFSSDLSDTQLRSTFGSLPAHTPMCILFSGADEFVPPSIDKAGLVKKWIALIQESGKVDRKHSGVVGGASHNLKGSPEPVVMDLLQRVLGFLYDLRFPAFL